MQWYNCLLIAFKLFEWIKKCARDASSGGNVEKVDRKYGRKNANRNIVLGFVTCVWYTEYWTNVVNVWKIEEIFKC